MATIITKDITEVSEVSSDATHTSTNVSTEGKAYRAKIEDLLSSAEDEEDIREGLKALAREEGTITWEQYQRQRAEREPQGELSG